MLAEVEKIQIMTFAMNKRPKVPYDQLPRRQDITTYPMDGAEFRDEAHPNVIFVARSSDQNWSNYRFEAWSRET